MAMRPRCPLAMAPNAEPAGHAEGKFNTRIPPAADAMAVQCIALAAAHIKG